mmetsp:Transcript_18397/g.52733  ORF Transcript_18397/g.52733 Transcript_18397/m.52733 type:complete len:205 (-) Transcript_18397:431-1045(-)
MLNLSLGFETLAVGLALLTSEGTSFPRDDDPKEPAAPPPPPPNFSLSFGLDGFAFVAAGAPASPWGGPFAAGTGLGTDSLSFTAGFGGSRELSRAPSVPLLLGGRPLFFFCVAPETMPAPAPPPEIFFSAFFFSRSTTFCICLASLMIHAFSLMGVWKKMAFSNTRSTSVQNSSRVRYVVVAPSAPYRFFLTLPRSIGRFTTSG